MLFSKLSLSYALKSSSAKVVEVYADRFRTISAKPLGRGSYGRVFECVDENTRQVFACKVMRDSLAFTKELQVWRIFSTELENLKDFVVQRVADDEQKNVIVMEMVKGKHLQDFYRHKDKELLRDLSKSLLLAVKALLEQKVRHNDLKGNNVMVVEGTRRVRLLDVGQMTLFDKRYETAGRDYLPIRTKSAFIDVYSAAYNILKLFNVGIPYWRVTEILWVRKGSDFGAMTEEEADALENEMRELKNSEVKTIEDFGVTLMLEAIFEGKNEISEEEATEEDLKRAKETVDKYLELIDKVSLGDEEEEAERGVDSCGCE